MRNDFPNAIDLKERPLPEITVKAVALGILLSVVLAGANAYLGLFAGMTVSASIPAAVVSMGVLRLFRRSNILENNIVQTAASAGESLAAGVIFTLPALVILNFWDEFNFLWVTVIAGFGGLLGVLFTIPLRRALIVEAKLKFPEGIATAEVLKSGQRKGDSGIKYIAQAAIAGGLFKLGGAGLRIWSEVFESAKAIGSSVAYFGSNLSPALLSVGYIVGLNIAVLIFFGGVANWLVAIPICAAFDTCPIVDGQPIPAVEWAHQIWSAKTRYIGVGGMLVGGLWTILKLRTSIFSGIASGLKAYRNVNKYNDIPRTEKDMPMKWIMILIIASVVPLFIVYQVFVQQISISIMMAITMLITGFLFSAVAGYMAGLVGSSNNPISGVTIATVLVASLLLVLMMGKGAANGPPAAIIIGSVVCCAAAIAGDNMQDLKAGYIVKATPWKQQVMQMVGTISAALVMAPILTLLFKAYGFAGHESATENALIAPQANLIASVAKGVFEGGLPWNFIFIGMAAAVIVIAADIYQERRGSSFRIPVLAVAIGIYLPLELEVPIFAGGIIHHALKVYHQRRDFPQEKVETSNRHGLLFASGLITGEALIGIALAVPIVISGKPDVLAIFNRPLGPFPGIVLLIAIAYWLAHIAKAKE
ncbi:MAG TPA: oligopeptide transporter, OPT family [Phycisphaerales bacterium]|nr:oligopeptide transporter, OPT family [Phycisphaerales bacterium]